MTMRTPPSSSSSSRRRTRMKTHQSFLLLSILIFLASTVNASIVITVPWSDEECYVIRTPQGPESSSFTVAGNFDLLDDSLDGSPTTVRILNDKLRPIYRSPYGVTEATFELPSIAANTRLSLCFENGRSRRAKQRDDQFDRTFGFEIRINPTIQQAEMKEETKRLLEQSENLQNKIYDLLNHQDYLRDREGIHRALTETTFTRVVRWTILEAVCLVCIAIAQVLYLRKFFETRRSL